MKIKVVCKKNNVSKNGTAPLYLRFTHNRETRLVSLGISLLPDYWNEDEQSINADYPNSRELQFEIEEKNAFVLIYLKMMLDLLVVIQFGHRVIKFLLCLSIWEIS